MATNPPPKAPAPRKRARRCKHTLLWVDDDPNVTAAIARRLLRRSIRVIPASDGMLGYWLALTRHPDAIVTDLRMPRWEGEDLIDCLNQNEATRPIPKIVLSGYAASLGDSYERDNGVEAVLDKPVDLERLVGLLLGCWSGSRDEPELANA